MIDEKSMSLGRDWAGEDVRGWIATEKYDGVRAYWDGTRLWTRSGREIDCPLTSGLPAFPLDFEIWAGRGGFLQARGATNYGRWIPSVRLVAIDSPAAPGGYRMRLIGIQKWLAGHPSVVVPASIVIDGIGMAREWMMLVQAEGGEGLILRDPGLPYTPGRNGFLKLTR